ncbi:hypothetical protein [Colwellia sp. E2M01]|uniref:hypothetical protein n=1 Tax=Colwellia sp. E2M01 TaxID=2841561 RepID=UPI001C09C03D|nr:hypothetical protein [Colwellia sp. E2M01]MBU2870904.1 hypothetical protein [Colwellia sp. E2M01]
MTDKNLIILLKISIGIGVCLLILSIYFHFNSEYIDSFGVKGIFIHAACIALGMLFSLPTKIYLTLLLMKIEEQERAELALKQGKSHPKPE